MILGPNTSQLIDKLGDVGVPETEAIEWLERVLAEQAPAPKLIEHAELRNISLDTEPNAFGFEIDKVETKLYPTRWWDHECPKRDGKLTHLTVEECRYCGARRPERSQA